MPRTCAERVVQVRTLVSLKRGFAPHTAIAATSPVMAAALTAAPEDTRATTPTLRSASIGLGTGVSASVPWPHSPKEDEPHAHASVLARTLKAMALVLLPRFER